MKLQSCLIFILFCIMSCSERAGNPSSGHGGEAMVSGTLLKSNGEVAADQEITLFPRNKSAHNFDIKDKIDTKCDKDGEYTFITDQLNNYTLSAISNNDFLFYPYVDFMKEKDHLELPQLNLEKGVKVIIKPWWNNDIENHAIAVEGTPWTFDVNSTDVDTLYLPVGPLTLIRYASGDDIPDTIKITIFDGIHIEKN